MSNNKKFVAPQGWVTAVHVNAIGITETAKHLNLEPHILAQALEKTGFQMIADPMDISADTAKVLEIQYRKTQAHLSVVKDKTDIAESLSELDEEQSENAT